MPVLVFVCIVVLLSACGNSSQEIGDSVPDNADSIEAEESGSHPEEENDLFGEVNVSVPTPEGGNHMRVRLIRQSTIRARPGLLL